MVNVIDSISKVAGVSMVFYLCLRVVDSEVGLWRNWKEVCRGIEI